MPRLLYPVRHNNSLVVRHDPKAGFCFRRAELVRGKTENEKTAVRAR